MKERANGEVRNEMRRRIWVVWMEADRKKVFS